MRGRGRHSRGRHGGDGIHMAASHQPAAVPGSSAAASPGEDDDDDDDDELAEFKREAAQLMQKAQQQQHLPAGLSSSTLASATKQLQSALGISKDDADAALVAVFEEHGANFDQWLDEAQLWLAVRAEADTEAEKLKEAMEVSLREQAEKRAAEQAAAPPLVNLSEDRLRRKFAGSAVLLWLDKCMPGRVLFSDASPLRELLKYRLVALLLLESNCCKWYPDAGTQHYFAAFGERCVKQLTSTRCSCSQIRLEPVQLGQQQQQQREASPAPQPVKRSSEQQSSADQQHAQRQAMGSSDTGTAKCRSSLPPAAAALAAGLAPAPAAASAGNSAGAAPNSAAAADGHATEPCSNTADAAEADPICGVKRSSRKRQAPSRFRSPSPAASDTMSGANKGSKGTRKRNPTPEAAAVPAKAARTAGATSVASSRAPSVDRTAMPPPPVRMSPDVCAAPSAIAAATASSNDTPAVLGQLQPHAVLQGQQQQQQSYQDQRLADLSSALDQHPAVIKQLSQMLEQEHKAVQNAIYAMPGTSGAVPDIFRGKPDAVPEEYGSDSDLEVVEEVSASAAAATMARRQTCSSAGEGLASTAAGAAPLSLGGAAAPPPPPATAAAAADSRPSCVPPPAAVRGLVAGRLVPSAAAAYAMCLPNMPAVPGGDPAQMQALHAYILQQQATQQQWLQQVMLQQQAALQQHSAQQQLADDDDVIIVD